MTEWHEDFEDEPGPEENPAYWDWLVLQQIEEERESEDDARHQ